MEQRVAAAEFRRTHLLLPLAAFLALMGLFSATSLDVIVAHAWAYDEAPQRWIGRGRWWADVLLHRDGRDAILLVMMTLLATLAAGVVSERARAARATVIYLLVTIGLGWGLVGGLKHATNVAYTVRRSGSSVVPTPANQRPATTIGARQLANRSRSAL